MSDTFCILPFIHLYADPKGEMKPCCISSGFDTPLNLKTMSIDESFNSEQMKQLRKDMVNGFRNKVCDVCYTKEDLNNHSPRIDFNNNPLWRVPSINEDFSVDSQFQHLDIRFSNLCNFKCRMCVHDFSSNWYEDTNKLQPNSTVGKPKVMKVSETIVEDLIPHLSNVRSVYFAGGEPLIMPEHYKLLNYLYDTTEVCESEKVRKVSIHYNTNLSVIKYDEQSLIDLWRGFHRVFLSISCDGIGEVGEYQRTGFNHDIFIKNLKTIGKYFEPKNVFNQDVSLAYNFQFTTTIWNVYHIFDFIDFMMENNFITSSEHIDFYYAYVPYSASLNNLSNGEKERAIKFLEDGLSDIENDKTLNEIKRIIKFIKSDRNTLEKSHDFISEPNEYIWDTVVGYTRKMDEMLETDVSKLNGVDFDEMEKTIL